MCLGIPMQIKAIDGLLARCEAKGIERDVRLLFLQGEDLRVGDFLVVERGNALERISAEHARAAWQVYDEMLALAGGPPAGDGD